MVCPLVGALETNSFMSVNNNILKASQFMGDKVIINDTALDLIEMSAIYVFIRTELSHNYGSSKNGKDLDAWSDFILHKLMVIEMKI